MKSGSITNSRVSGFVSTTLLVAALASSAGAADHEASKVVLRGSVVDDGDGAVVAALDDRRLAVVWIAQGKTGDRVVIPTSSESDVQLSPEGNFALVRRRADAAESGYGLEMWNKDGRVRGVDGVVGHGVSADGAAWAVAAREGRELRIQSFDRQGMLRQEIASREPVSPKGASASETVPLQVSSSGDAVALVPSPDIFSMNAVSVISLVDDAPGFTYEAATPITDAALVDAERLFLLIDGHVHLATRNGIAASAAAVDGVTRFDDITLSPSGRHLLAHDVDSGSVYVFAVETFPERAFALDTNAEVVSAAVAEVAGVAKVGLASGITAEWLAKDALRMSAPNDDAAFVVDFSGDGGPHASYFRNIGRVIGGGPDRLWSTGSGGDALVATEAQPLPRGTEEFGVLQDAH